VALLKLNQKTQWVPQNVMLGVGAVIVLAALGYLLFGGKPEEEADPSKVAVPQGEFNAFAGGYPVPPLPGQKLPELASVVPSTAQAVDEVDEESTHEGDES